MVPFRKLALVACLLSLSIFNCRKSYARTMKEDGVKSHLNILAFGDSLTEGYFDHGMAFHPYSGMLQKLLKEDAGLDVKVGPPPLGKGTVGRGDDTWQKASCYRVVSWPELGHL